MSDCRFGVSPVNYPDPDPKFVTVRIVRRRTSVISGASDRSGSVTAFTDNRSYRIRHNELTVPGRRTITGVLNGYRHRKRYWVNGKQVYMYSK